jgi:hypothetical protein
MPISTYISFHESAVCKCAALGNYPEGRNNPATIRKLSYLVDIIALDSDKDGWHEGIQWYVMPSAVFKLPNF